MAWRCSGFRLGFVLVSAAAALSAQSSVPVQEGGYILRDYRFRSGDTLPEVRLHYRTIGTPLRDSRGQIRNGVLVMHGSSGDASQVLAASMKDPLVRAGGPLDPAKYFLEPVMKLPPPRHAGA